MAKLSGAFSCFPGHAIVNIILNISAAGNVFDEDQFAFLFGNYYASILSGQCPGSLSCRGLRRRW